MQCHELSMRYVMSWTMLTNRISSLQSATFNYNMVYKVARATSDEVRSKVPMYAIANPYHSPPPLLLGEGEPLPLSSSSLPSPSLHHLRLPLPTLLLLLPTLLLLLFSLSSPSPSSTSPPSPPPHSPLLLLLFSSSLPSPSL